MDDDLIARLRFTSEALRKEHFPTASRNVADAIARITTLTAERDALRRERVDKARAWDACIAARKDERAKALEEAAKVADQWNELSPFSSRAQAIRALASDALLDRQGNGKED